MAFQTDDDGETAIQEPIFPSNSENSTERTDTLPSDELIPQYNVIDLPALEMNVDQILPLPNETVFDRQADVTVPRCVYIIATLLILFEQATSGSTRKKLVETMDQNTHCISIKERVRHSCTYHWSLAKASPSLV